MTRACGEEGVPLPKTSITQQLPFEVVGVDFAGPLYCIHSMALIRNLMWHSSPVWSPGQSTCGWWRIRPQHLSHGLQLIRCMKRYANQHLFRQFSHLQEVISADPGHRAHTVLGFARPCYVLSIQLGIHHKEGSVVGRPLGTYGAFSKGSLEEGPEEKRAQFSGATDHPHRSRGNHKLASCLTDLTVRGPRWHTSSFALTSSVGKVIDTTTTIG